MNRILLGAVSALLLASAGVFWWQGRAEVEQGAPPPAVQDDTEPVGDPDALPSADPGALRGPAPPEATEQTREQRRFGRYDRNRDGRVSRNEMLSSRTPAFRKLDRDGNNLLTFEEWAAATVQRFDGADADRDRALSPQEFATTRPKPQAAARCRC